jgi:hypothetical protein
MLGDSSIEQDSQIVGVPAEILIPPTVAMRRSRGRGGSRGGATSRRRRPRYADRAQDELSQDERYQEEGELDAGQEPIESPGFLPTPAGARSFAQVAAGAATASKPAKQASVTRPPTPPSASTPSEVPPTADPTNTLSESPTAPSNDQMYHSAQPDAYPVSTEEYPGYTATTTTPEGVYDPDSLPFYAQYPTGMAYYYQDQYGQYSYIPSADGTWYPDPNAAVFVPSPHSSNYVPLSALNPAGPGGQGYYSHGYQGAYHPYHRGGKNRGNKRGGRGRESSRGSRFGLPGFFQAHLPPFYGPQATSFPMNSSNPSAGNPPSFDAHLGNVASLEAHSQANPLYPYPFVDPTNLFVFHLPITLDEKGLRRLFEQFGRVEGVRVARDKQTRKSKGYGFVKFRRMQDAIQAVMQMNGYTLENKHLKVAFKSAFSDRLPTRRRNNRSKLSRHPDAPAEETAAATTESDSKSGRDNGFSDEPDSDEEAAFDQIIAQEDQREQAGEKGESESDKESSIVGSSSPVAAH